MYYYKLFKIEKKGGKRGRKENYFEKSVEYFKVDRFLKM